MTATAEFDKWGLAAADTLQLLTNTFGADDERVIVAEQNYQKMLVSGSPIAYMLGSMYLNWCAMNPGHILDAPFARCDCENGFKSMGDGLYRPCNTCLEKTFESWQKESGYGYNGEF